MNRILLKGILVSFYRDARDNDWEKALNSHTDEILSLLSTKEEKVEKENICDVQKLDKIIKEEMKHRGFSTREEFEQWLRTPSKEDKEGKCPSCGEPIDELDKRYKFCFSCTEDFNPSKD